MKGKQKAVFGQRIDIEIIGGINRSAQKRGESVAHMTELALSQYLSNDVELTAIERANYKKKCIESALDGISSTLNIHLEGDLVSKTMTIMAVCSGFDTVFPDREDTSRAKLSLFEVLIDIKDYDKGVFNEIFPYLKKFKKLHSMYTQTVF